MSTEWTNLWKLGGIEICAPLVGTMIKVFKVENGGPVHRTTESDKKARLLRSIAGTSVLVFNVNYMGEVETRRPITVHAATNHGIGCTSALWGATIECMRRGYSDASLHILEVTLPASPRIVFVCCNEYKELGNLYANA